MTRVELLNSNRFNLTPTNSFFHIKGKTAAFNIKNFCSELTRKDRSKSGRGLNPMETTTRSPPLIPLLLLNLMG